MAVLTETEVEDIEPTAKVLEIGCGQERRVPHSVTLDLNTDSLADTIHNLDEFPYPFPDNSFDIIIAEHVLEHLQDVIRVVEELHRILKPGGRLLVEVPHYSSSNFHTDPTHRHAFGVRSFDYFVPGTDLARYRYSPAHFEKRYVSIDFWPGPLMPTALAAWLKRHMELYEQRLAFIFPAERINFELSAIK